MHYYIRERGNDYMTVYLFSSQESSNETLASLYIVQSVAFDLNDKGIMDIDYQVGQNPGNNLLCLVEGPTSLILMLYTLKIYRISVHITVITLHTVDY